MNAPDASHAAAQRALSFRTPLSDVDGRADRADRGAARAVMHPSPRVDKDRDILREQSFYEVEMELLDGIITNVTRLIQRIDTELNGIFGRVETWLRERGVDRRFPKETFY